jgi:hypothetical protein
MGLIVADPIDAELLREALKDVAEHRRHDSARRQ